MSSTSRNPNHRFYNCVSKYIIISHEANVVMEQYILSYKSIIIMQNMNNCRFFKWNDEEKQFQIEVKFEDIEETTIEIETEKKVVDVNDYDSELLQKLQLLQINDSSDDEYDH